MKTSFGGDILLVGDEVKSVAKAPFAIKASMSYACALRRNSWKGSFWNFSGNGLREKLGESYTRNIEVI